MPDASRFAHHPHALRNRRIVSGHAILQRVRRQAMTDRDFGKAGDAPRQRRQIGDRQIVAGIDGEPGGKRRIGRFS